jgi:methyl-accepting chemotaxis protein
LLCGSTNAGQACRTKPRTGFLGVSLDNREFHLTGWLQNPADGQVYNKEVKMRFLADLAITKKIWLLVGVLMACMILSGVLLLSREKASMEAEKMLATKHVVETATGIVAYYEGLSRTTGMPTREAQERAIAAIKSLRYEDKEYFWINDMHPTMIMHPTKPELDGQDLTDNKDPDGKRLFVEFANVVKRDGAGYVSYMWPKPGSDQPVPKISYVNGFAPWGWVIGSGIYLDDVSAAFWGGVWRMGAIFLFILSGMAIFVFMVIKGITRPLNEAVKIAQRVAEGDLSQSIDVHSQDETGLLMQALKNMNTSLADIVSQVRRGTETITVASREIASGNADLSGRTESQASSLEETASSMEELTSTVKQNAEHAQHASQLVSSTANIAAHGGEVVGQVIDTMGSIKESSRKIADIISVIDGIAFQTNILALNAAVEAARAGEQGRGFAVVASEVRNLAQRSAGAAKEIKTLISDSVEKVETGRKLVAEAGEAMDDIVTSVQLVADIISGTAIASQEQSAGIEQVNQAVGQMDEMTQQNAALVEQAATAAESLQEQASQLAQAVSVFKLDGARHAVQPALQAQRHVAEERTPARLKSTHKPAARPRALAAAGGGNGEWEEF